MKQIRYLVDVTDNPMVKLSDQTNTYLLETKEKHLLIMRNWIQLSKVPYCDQMNPEESYFVVSVPKQPLNPNAPYKKDVPSNRCIMRIANHIIFHKKIPLFQGRIERGAVEKGIEAFGILSQWALTKVDEFRSINPLPKPIEVQTPVPTASLKKKAS